MMIRSGAAVTLSARGVGAGVRGRRMLFGGGSFGVGGYVCMLIIMFRRIVLRGAGGGSGRGRLSRM